tara:strand:- start:65 stop:346 length:282 start_codon:yes stop_codon:yes gene_type:complete
MNRKKLINLRKKIDKLDNKIFNLIRTRTYLVNKMIAIKNNRSQIVDKKRMKTILNKIKKKSLKYKIDPKITNTIWNSMIWAFIKYQRKNFGKK